MSHGNERLTVCGRQLLVRRICQEGWRVAEAALAAGVSRQTASKWLARYRLEGPCGLADRRSRPHRIARVLPAAAVRSIVRGRLRFRVGPHRLSWMLGLARSSIYAVLRRLGLSRLCHCRCETDPLEWN